MLRVAEGEAELAVVDSDLAVAELGERPELKEGPVIAQQMQLRWVFNRSSPLLVQDAERFLNRSRVSGLLRQLELNYLSRWTPYVSPDRPRVPSGSLTPFDEVVKWAARRRRIDWRLLASLMYEESRFDPFAVGPGGSAGLFQLMPSTWQELGVDDPHQPLEATEAAADYLQGLMESFSSLKKQDQVALALAAYNVGPRHVHDARRLARRMGLDPDRFTDNVESALLVLDDPAVAGGYPAGVCKCRRAVRYTRRILRRYRAYVEQFPPE